MRIIVDAGVECVACAHTFSDESSLLEFRAFLTMTTSLKNTAPAGPLNRVSSNFVERLHRTSRRFLAQSSV